MDVASHACPQAFHRWLLSCCVPAWLCVMTVVSLLCSSADTCGTFWPCCILLPTQRGSGTDPWLPSHGLGLQCQDGPFSRDRGRIAAVGAAVSGALLCGTAWQEHRGLENHGFIEKNSGQQSAPFTCTEHQNAAELDLLEEFSRQQLFFLSQHQTNLPNM